MKKAVPEVRMTEAARKRSAKIRQNKETAENKPESPKFTPRTRVKPLGTRSGTLEKKATGSSMSNIEIKKPKIDDTIKPRRVAREPLKQSVSTLNQRTGNTIKMRPAPVPLKKMSSITAAKVKEREEKQKMIDRKCSHFSHSVLTRVVVLVRNNPLLFLQECCVPRTYLQDLFEKYHQGQYSTFTVRVKSRRPFFSNMT